MSAATISTKTGIANLPLHYGKVPPWLFDRVGRLEDEVTVLRASAAFEEARPWVHKRPSVSERGHYRKL